MADWKKKLLIQYYAKEKIMYILIKKDLFKIDPEVTRKQFFVKYLFSMKYKMKSIKKNKTPKTTLYAPDKGLFNLMSCTK